PDRWYLKLMFRYRLDERLNLKKPETFNEKLQWLKLYNRNPDYTHMVDKFEVRKYIQEKIGEEYLIPLLGVYNTVEEIDFSALPNQFVLKCTHDSGRIIICKNKKYIDINNIKRKITESLNENYYFHGRE